MKHEVRKKVFHHICSVWRTERWVMDSPQTTDEWFLLCRTGRLLAWAEALAVISSGDCHNLGLGTHEQTAQWQQMGTGLTLHFHLQGFSGIFLCLLWYDTMKDCICGWSLYWGTNCQQWGANHPLSNKRNEGLKAAHPTERRNYTGIRRFGAKGLLLMCSYWCSISSFQRQGRGNWCVKINCGCKKTICQTTCWLQSH